MVVVCRQTIQVPKKFRQLKEDPAKGISLPTPFSYPQKEWTTEEKQAFYKNLPGFVDGGPIVSKMVFFQLPGEEPRSLTGRELHLAYATAGLVPDVAGQILARGSEHSSTFWPDLTGGLGHVAFLKYNPLILGVWEVI